ncbi:MAG: SdpI family protein [Bacteroidetes bacterium]|nr:SdpI family protein [Bacteroidota bacterium]
MKNLNLKIEMMLWAIAVLPLIYLATTYAKLPAEVPTHFGLDGKPNGFSSKQSFVFILLAMNVGTYLLMLFLPKIDSKKNISLEQSIYTKLRVLLQLFMAAISVFIIYSALSTTVQVAAIYLILGLFFALMGNYIQAVKPNYFVGIRTPWTLQNDVVWQKTHRVGGKLWFWGGLAMATLAFMVPVDYQPHVILGLIAVMVLYPLGYSYWAFKQEEKKSEG